MFDEQWLEKFQAYVDDKIWDVGEKKKVIQKYDRYMAEIEEMMRWTRYKIPMDVLCQSDPNETKGEFVWDWKNDGRLSGMSVTRNTVDSRLYLQVNLVGVLENNREELNWYNNRVFEIRNFCIGVEENTLLVRRNCRSCSYTVDSREFGTFVKPVIEKVREFFRYMMSIAAMMEIEEGDR